MARYWLCFAFEMALLASHTAHRSNAPCDEVHAIARITSEDSLAGLARAKQLAEHSYLGQIVFAARSFELQPRSTSAANRLLDLLPRDDVQHTVLMTLGDSLCDGESVGEMKSMSRMGERLSHDFAEAVLLAPDKLPRYISYASTSTLDPHSDYAVQMQSVCRAKHSEFMKALEGLPADERLWFVDHIFNPEGCHAIALPEAG